MEWGQVDDRRRIMYTHNGKGLRQIDLFPRSGKKDRAYRAALKYTGVPA